MIHATDSKSMRREFPGGPVVKTLPSNVGGASTIPGWGSKVPHASQTKNQNETEAIL